MAAAPSPARTRPRSIARPLTRRAISPRTSSRPASRSSCTIQIAYAIGVADPMSLYVDTHGTGKVEREEAAEDCCRNFSRCGPPTSAARSSSTGRSTGAPRLMAISAARRTRTAVFRGNAPISPTRSSAPYADQQRRFIALSWPASCRPTRVFDNPLDWKTWIPATTRLCDQWNPNHTRTHARSSDAVRATNCARAERSSLRRCCRGLRSTFHVPAPADLRTLFSAAGHRCRARDRLRRRRIDDCAGRGAIRDIGIHRRRALRQRHGQGARRHREREGLQNIRLHFDDAVGLIAWLPDASLSARRPHSSRSMAEAPALEAPLRSGRDGRAACAHPAPGRRVSLCHRYGRLCRLDAAAPAALGRISSGRRNAPTTGASAWPGFHATRYHAKAAREERASCFLIFRRR